MEYLESVIQFDVSNNQLSGSLAFIRDIRDSLIILEISGNHFDKVVEADAFALISDSREAEVFIYMTDMAYIITLAYI